MVSLRPIFFMKTQNWKMYKNRSNRNNFKVALISILYIRQNSSILGILGNL